MEHDSQIIKQVIDAVRSEIKPGIDRFIRALESFSDSKQELHALFEKLSALEKKVASLQEILEIHESKISSILEYSAFVKESVSSVEKIPDKKLTNESDKNSDGYKSVIRLSIVELRDINQLSYQEIADKLNAEGIQTFRKSGKKWYPQTVQKIYKQMKQNNSK